MHVRRTISSKSLKVNGKPWTRTWIGLDDHRSERDRPLNSSWVHNPTRRLGQPSHRCTAIIRQYGKVEGHWWEWKMK